MNILIETDEEVILLHTQSMKRAKEVLKKGNISYTDLYEIQDEEIPFHYYDERITDPKFKNKAIK